MERIAHVQWDALTRRSACCRPSIIDNVQVTFVVLSIARNFDR